MYEKIPLIGLSREKWLKLRKNGLGGSDAGAVCGLNPYRSAMQVYLDKTSEDLPDEDNEAMRQGRDLEEYVAQRFMEATGLKVRRSNFMYRDKEHPWMIADVDRLVVGEEAGLECKTASAFSEDKWKDGSIPEHYLLQCYHYMAVTGKRTWYLAVVILGVGFQYRKLVWKDDIIEKLTAVEEAFWNQHVDPKIMPAPDGTDACDEALAQAFGQTRKGSKIRLVGFDEKLKRREELIELSKQFETEQRQIEQEIKLYMKEHEQAFSEKYRVSWPSIERILLDTKRLREEQPETYQRFLKTSSARRFQIKAA